MEARRLIFLDTSFGKGHLDSLVETLAPLLGSGDELLVADGSGGGSEWGRRPAGFTALFPTRPLEPGESCKLAFRYAIDGGFESVVRVPVDQPLSAETLRALLGALTHSPAALAWVVSAPKARSWSNPLLHRLVKDEREVSSALRYATPLAAFRTEYLRNLPFERNSDDEGFDDELLFQSLVSGAVAQVVPMAAHDGRHPRRLPHKLRLLRLALHYHLFRMGFLYDRRLDVVRPEYPGKPSRYSTHLSLIRRIPAGATVLDIGCGTGIVARGLLEKGCTVDGVDLLNPSDVSVPLRNYWSVDLNKNPEALEGILRGHRYDYIVLADVIEHLVAPEDFLDLLRRSLGVGHRPTLLVSTGNVAFIIVRAMLALGQFNYGPRGILDRTHTRLFTRKSFNELFQQCGYQVRDRKWIPFPVTSVLPNSSLGRGLEGLANGLARLRPGLFAYQMLFDLLPRPTSAQLLGESATSQPEPRPLRIVPPAPSESAVAPTE